MAAIREGRTAVITVTDGWKLFQPDPALTVQRKNDSARTPIRFPARRRRSASGRAAD